MFKQGRPLSVFPEESGPGTSASPTQRSKTPPRSKAETGRSSSQPSSRDVVTTAAKGKKSHEARSPTRPLEILKPCSYVPPPPRPVRPDRGPAPPHFEVTVSAGDPWLGYDKVRQLTPNAFVVSKKKAFKLFEMQEKPIDAGVKLDSIRSSQSPFVVDILAAFRWSGTLYLVYELIEPTLLDICAGVHVPMSISQAALITRDILEGLQWMHEALSRGHGSIKHCNIVVTEGGMSRIASLADGELAACEPAADMEALGDVFAGLLSKNAPLLDEDTVETWPQDVREFRSSLASKEPRFALQAHCMHFEPDELEDLRLELVKIQQATRSVLLPFSE